MIEGISLAQVAFKVAPILISFGSREILRRLTDDSPTSKAIATTCEAYDEIEGLQSSLRNWCQSDTFWVLFEKLHGGDRQFTDADITTNFVGATGFYMGENTEAVAQDILQEFMENLVRELYSANGGVAVLANRIEILDWQSTEQSAGIGIQITEMQDSLKQLTSALVPEDIESSPQVQEIVLTKGIDAARRLILAGQAVSARIQLLEIRDGAAKMATSAQLRFRIATNLGACALALEDWDEAKIELRDALRLQPNDPKALRNAGVVALLEDDCLEALELSKRAIERDPEQKQGVDVYLESLFKLEMLEELDDYLATNNWIIEDLACPLILARIEVERGRYDQAESLITRSLELELESDTGLKHALLGQIISAPIRQTLNIDPPLPWKFPEDVDSQLQRADFHLTKAIELLQNRQDRGRLNDALVNRSGVRGMLGKYSEGLEDCNRVLFDNPQDSIAIRNKGVMLFNLEQTAEAIRFLEQLSGSDVWPSLALMVASGYEEIGEPGKAIDTIKPHWNPEEGDHHQLLIAHFLLRAYHELNDRGQIEEISNHIKSVWPNDPEALHVLAQQRHRDGEVDESIELMRESLSYSQGNQRDRIALQLAETLHAERQYAQAAEVYRLVVNTSENNFAFRGYLSSLYNAGLYSEAFKLASEMRREGTPIPFVTEIEASILEYIGDLRAAEILWLGLAIVQPNKANHIIGAAFAQFRQGLRESAKETINSLGYEIIKDDPKALMDVARAKTMVDDVDVLPLVYRARRIDFGNPETHLAYCGFFLASEKRGTIDFRPTEVGVDCTVHLVSNGEKRIFTILDEDSIDPARGELSPADPLALRLAGRKEGDRLVIKQSYEDIEYEVSTVQSKYVHAFQQTMSDFSTLFPNHMGIQKMSIKDDDFSIMLKSVDERHKFVSEIIDHYRRKEFTLGAVAQLVGNNQVEVWRSLCIRPGELFLVASGSRDERDRESISIRSADHLVMDLTSMLTLNLLGLLDVVSERFAHILVAQAVLDELNEAIMNGYLGALPSAVISKEGEHYIHNEITADDFEKGKVFLEGIRDFIESKAEVIPASGMLDIDYEENQRYRELIGTGSLASVIGSRDRDALLYSDDLALRTLARASDQLGNIEGISIVTVLSELRAGESLSDDEYFNAILLLVLSNYSFVPLDADALMWVFKKNGYQSTPEVAKVFATLKGPDCNESSAVIVAANLTRKAWLELDLLHQKIATLNLLLEALATARVEAQVISSFKRLLSQRFNLMPFALKLIFEHIENWQRQHLTIGGSMLWLPGQSP